MLSYFADSERGQRVQAGAVIPGIGQHLAKVNLASSYWVPGNSQKTRNINFIQRLFPMPGNSSARPLMFKKSCTPPPLGVLDGDKGQKPLQFVTVFYHSKLTAYFPFQCLLMC